MTDNEGGNPARMSATVAIGLALTALGIAVPVSGGAIRMAWDAGRTIERMERDAAVLRRDLESTSKAADDRQRGIEGRLTETEKAVTQAAIAQATTQAELRGINQRLDEIKVLLGNGRR